MAPHQTLDGINSIKKGVDDHVDFSHSMPGWSGGPAEDKGTLEKPLIFRWNDWFFNGKPWFFDEKHWFFNGSGWDSPWADVGERGGVRGL